MTNTRTLFPLSPRTLAPPPKRPRACHLEQASRSMTEFLTTLLVLVGLSAEIYATSHDSASLGSRA